MSKLVDHLFNFKESLFHRVSDEEIALIKDTHLFSHLDDKAFKTLLNAIKLQKYPAGKSSLKKEIQEINYTSS